MHQVNAARGNSLINVGRSALMPFLSAKGYLSSVFQLYMDSRKTLAKVLHTASCVPNLAARRGMGHSEGK
jgi:hypothetical protein